jgi:hypothetical protein
MGSGFCLAMPTLQWCASCMGRAEGRKPQWRRVEPQIRSPKRVQGIVAAEGLGVSPNCLSYSPFPKGGLARGGSGGGHSPTSGLSKGA